MKSIYRSFVILFLLVIIYPLVSYAGPPSIPGSGATSYSQIVGLFGSGSCTGFLYSDGTCATGGTGDVLGPVTSTQYKIPLWGGTNKTLVDGVAVGTEGMILRSAGAGANPAWSAYTLALPGAAGAVLYSDGTNWARSTAPSLLALTLYGQSEGGGAQLALGSSSGSTDPNDGKALFRNATNGNYFTITSGVTGANIGWTLPTAAPGGANYLLNVDADGTMGYTDPSTLVGYTNLTSFVGQTAWRLFYSNADGDVTELALGSDGTYLRSNGASAAPTFDTPSGAAHDAVTLSTDLGNNLLGLSTQQLTLDNQTANYIFAGPTTGAAAAPSFRALVVDDIPDLSGTYQPLDSTLTGLAGIAITVDGNNVTFPGGVITTAANGSRIVSTLDNTTTLTFLTAGTYGWYFYNGVPYFNINGTGYKSMYEGLSTGGLLFGDSSPDAAGEIGYDGELKYYDAVGSKTVATVSGALGTPSFTALNMPSSDADPGTTAGQIKHDSTDTSSNSGGTAKWYDGAQVRSLVDTGTNYTIITKEEYLPIRYAEDDDSVTAPAAAAEIGTTSMIGRSFAEDADNGVVFFWKVPNDYVGGIKFRVNYAIDTNASADETVAFGLSGCSIGNSDAIACSEGTAVNVTQELTTDEDTGELLITSYSGEVTVTNIAAGEIVKLLFIRDVSEDDAAGHTLVTGIDIKYKAKIIGIGGY